MKIKKGLKVIGLAVAGTAGSVAVGALAAGAEAASQGILNPEALATIAVVGAAGGGVAYWKRRKLKTPPLSDAKTDE